MIMMYPGVGTAAVGQRRVHHEDAGGHRGRLLQHRPRH